MRMVMTPQEYSSFYQEQDCSTVFENFKIHSNIIQAPNNHHNEISQTTNWKIKKANAK